MRLPSVIVYRTSALNAFIARLVINIPNIGLPNIVAGENDYAGAAAGGLHPGKISENCSRAFAA